MLAVFEIKLSVRGVSERRLEVIELVLQSKNASYFSLQELIILTYQLNAESIIHESPVILKWILKETQIG